MRERVEACAADKCQAASSRGHRPESSWGAPIPETSDRRSPPDRNRLPIRTLQGRCAFARRPIAAIARWASRFRSTPTTRPPVSRSGLRIQANSGRWCLLGFAGVRYRTAKDVTQAEFADGLLHFSTLAPCAGEFEQKEWARLLDRARVQWSDALVSASGRRREFVGRVTWFPKTCCAGCPSHN